MLGCGKVYDKFLRRVKSAKRSVSNCMENNVRRRVSNILSITYRSTASQPVPSWTACLTASGVSRNSRSMSSNRGWSRFRRLKWPTVLLRFAASRESFTPIRCWRYSRCALDMCQMGKESSCGTKIARHPITLVLFDTWYKRDSSARIEWNLNLVINDVKLMAPYSEDKVWELGLSGKPRPTGPNLPVVSVDLCYQ